MLNPSNTTAFVTGVTFTGDGEFTGTQMPLVSEVPEPPSAMLLGGGLLAMSGLLRRQIRSRMQVTVLGRKKAWMPGLRRA